jgi:hypothetical protein
MMETLEQIITVYNAWLDRQPLAAKLHHQKIDLMSKFIVN